ncbi:MAG TPA: 3-hydroxyacyl-CoA dehydrogenase NAD-binding domain-containing protein [Ideonella sp.]|nr:3-hydroxyacyl-CoA dehydrogenase NAD-binding domain-containing protein [Ideonella sp.]
MSASYELRGPVAVITLNNPPVNGLGAETRQGLSRGLARAQADANVKAVVLVGAGKGFSSGLDVKEYGTPLAQAEPGPGALVSQLEASAKPVVAALHGPCLGSGLELALACHYRVAAPGTTLGLPEIKLGLTPASGSATRLVRLLDAQSALNLLVSGDALQAEALAGLAGQRLVDRIAEGDLLEAAVAFAGEVAGTRPLPRARDLPVLQHDAAAWLHEARSTVAAMPKVTPAMLRAVDALESALTTDADAALQGEQAVFEALAAVPETRAARHVQLAERAVARLLGVPEDTPARPLAKVAVIGTGTMGSGIAMAFMNAGIPVVLLARRQVSLDRCVAEIRKTYEDQVEKGQMKASRYEQRMAQLVTTMDYADIADADIAIEAVSEDMALKREVFEKLDAVMKPGAILASNTSMLDLNQIAAFTKRPQDVIGLHFFSPAHLMRLLEVVRGAQTADDVLASAMQVGRKLRKTCVVAAVCDGFIGNRMIEQYSRQACFLLDEGCTPEQVDAAMEKFGFAMGPFRMNDLAGNDVGWYVRKRRAVERPGMRYSRTADLLCEMGRFGHKTGGGWYAYPTGGYEPVTSPVVQQMIVQHREASGIAPREIGDEEIVQRLVYALVNEAAQLLDEGVASRASDVDLVYLAGYGFPVHSGGPLCHADMVGLPKVIAAMQRFATNPLDDAAFWQPAPLLVRLAAEGRSFS